MQFDVPLRLMTDGTDFPRLGRRVHIAALRTDPEHRRFVLIQRPFFQRVIKIIEHDMVIVFYLRDEFKPLGDIGKSLFFRNFGKAGIDLDFFFFVVRGKAQTLR